MPQQHTREFKVGEKLTAIVHASRNDYDTSSYQQQPMKVNGKILKEKVVVVKVMKRGRVDVQEIGASYITELQAVRGGFYQCIYGPSVAYKF